MSKTILYPQRQRCRTCRRYWGFGPVLRLLYCSPECAGRPPIPMSEVNGVLVPPRTCRTILRGARPGGTPRFRWKAVFATEEEANAFGRRNGAHHAYECPNCWWWHNTSRGPREDLREEQEV